MNNVIHNFNGLNKNIHKFLLLLNVFHCYLYIVPVQCLLVLYIYFKTGVLLCQFHGNMKLFVGLLEIFKCLELLISHQLKYMNLLAYNYNSFEQSIYPKLMNVSSHNSRIDQQNQAKDRLKLILSLTPPLNKWKKSVSSSRNRYLRLNQLITTQQDYYNDLKMLQQRVKQPLIKEHIISQQRANVMFNNLQNMMELSQKLRSGLVDKFEHWDHHKTVFGEYMIQFSNFFILYSDYFKNYMQTQQYLNQLINQHPKVKQIQRTLSSQKKIQTIGSLIARPFQRSLKYKDILEGYLQKLYKSHPDYYHIKNAANSYRRVSQKNNTHMQNKQKDNILMVLHSKYSKIIQSQARFYVDQYHAHFIELPVLLYLFSDLILIVNQNTEKEHSRLFLNKDSLATISNNHKKYLNGLFLYANGGTLFLTFKNTLQRDNIHLKLKNMIKNINENQFSREKLIALRMSRNQTKRNIYLPDRQPQFYQPLICTVVGIQKRRVSQEKTNEFYVIQFKAMPKYQNIKYPPQQLSLITWEQLLKLQEFIHQYYGNEVNLISLNYLPKGVKLQPIDQHQDLKHQIRSIVIQLFLNQVFREDAILKKVDIICKKLDICDSIWSYLGSPVCYCQLCGLKTYYQSYDQYHYEVIKRIDSSKKKRKKCVQFCEVRTISSQLMITDLPINGLQNLNKVQRIYWMRARRGFIDHSLTNLRPVNPIGQMIKLVVWFHNIKGNSSIQIYVNPNIRIKSIVDKLSERLNFDLSDYTLELHLGEHKYVLSQDEIIGNIYVQQHQPGLISKLFSIFSDQDYPQSFYLRKLWVLEPKFQFGSSIDKILFEVQQILYRIIYGQIQISIQEIHTIFACYQCYTKYSQLSYLRNSTVDLKKDEFTLKSNRYKQTINMKQIAAKILDLKQNNKIKRQDFLFKIISTVICKPGWSCPMFKALQKTNLGYFIIRVRIGCDLKGIHVYNDSCIKKKYQFKHQEKYWSNQLIGQEMIIKHPQGTLYFKGREMWKLQQQINFFQIYHRTFIVK